SHAASGSVWMYSEFTGYTAAADQEAWVTFSSLGSCSDFTCMGGPMVRSDGADNFYALNVGANATTIYSEIVLFRSDDTTDTLVNELVTQFVSGNKGKIRVVGSNFTAYRDSGGGFVSLMSGSNAEFGSGQPGMILFNTSLTASNFVMD